jgi:hypothetical protein
MRTEKTAPKSCWSHVLSSMFRAEVFWTFLAEAGE